MESNGRKYSVQKSSLYFAYAVVAATLITVAIQPAFAPHAALFLAAAAAMIAAKDGSHAHGNRGEHLAKAEIAKAEIAAKKDAAKT